MTAAQRDPDGNFVGFEGSHCEHRTVGDHRAWCHDDGEWCYPDDGCRGCADADTVPVDRDLLRDLQRFLWYVAANAPGDARTVAKDLANRLPDPDEDD